MEEIIVYLGRFLFWLVCCFVMYALKTVTPVFKAWLTAHANRDTADNVLALVDSFVRAADQLYHDDDPTGEKRQAYVKKQLMDTGVELSNAVLSMIEGAVFNVNIERKSVIVAEEIPTATTGYVTTVTTTNDPVVPVAISENTETKAEEKKEEKKATTKAVKKSNVKKVTESEK